MPATLNYAQAYQQGLQNRYSENGLLFTQKLWNSPSNTLLKFTGAKEVKVPRLLIKEGRKDRTRRTITNIDANYENQCKTFNDTEKVPEMDKFMVSKLFSRKKALDTESKQIKSLNLTEENFLATFDELMEQMDEAGVPAEGRVIFCTPAVKRMIKNIKQFGRTVNIHGQGTVIDRSIGRLDDVTIEPSIPSDRMKTLYNFTNGAKVDPTAKQIHFFLIHIPCIAAPQKYEFVGLDAPSASSSGNYLYYEQSYDDVLLFKTKHEGLAFVVAP